MTEAKCYTVMELAEKVGVPRTTINDWLGKYSTYIGFVMQGKRRVYTETTLSVLLKVSELRAAMKSSFEIEQELASIYAIHPEFAEEAVEEVVEELAEENSHIKVCKVNVDEQFELAVRYQVSSIPTLMFFKDGKAVRRAVGLRSKAEIEQLIAECQHEHPAE